MFHLTQMAVVLIISTTMCVIALTGRDVPGWLIGILTTIVGYYLGSTRVTKNAIPD